MVGHSPSSLFLPGRDGDRLASRDVIRADGLVLGNRLRGFDVSVVGALGAIGGAVSAVGAGLGRGAVLGICHLYLVAVVVLEVIIVA